MSVCDLCRSGRCTDNLQCEYDLFKKGIVLLASGMRIINKHLSAEQINRELNKKFMEGK